MIKVNLAKGRASSGPATSASSPNSNDAIGSGDLKALRKTAVMRMLLIVLGPIALLVIEQQTIPVLEAQQKANSAELNRLSTKNRQAIEAVSQIKKFKKEQETLQAQINSIEALKKDRLREVKILDFVQKDLPDHLWLTRMEMNEGKMNIQGLATTDNELTQFMDTLSRSAYLREVSLVRSNDMNSPELGVLKHFEISCLMEKMQ